MSGFFVLRIRVRVDWSSSEKVQAFHRILRIAYVVLMRAVLARRLRIVRSEEIVRGLASGHSIGTVQIIVIVHMGIWTKQVAAFDWAGFASRVLNGRRHRH